MRISRRPPGRPLQIVRRMGLQVAALGDAPPAISFGAAWSATGRAARQKVRPRTLFDGRTRKPRRFWRLTRHPASTPATASRPQAGDPRRGDGDARIAQAGLFVAAAEKHVGALYLADLGVPPGLYAEPSDGAAVGPLFARSDIPKLT